MDTNFKSTKEFAKHAQVTIIGKKYKPFDNSWGFNLTDQRLSELKNNYIAGTVASDGKIVTIVTDPFELHIIWLNGHIVRSFVIVIDEAGNNHLTLYHPDWIIK